MARTHYHVVENTPGYLPDSDMAAFPYSSRRAAEREAADLARQLRDEGYSTVGNSRQGFYRASLPRENDLGRVIDIIPCDCADCFTEEDR